MSKKRNDCSFSWWRCLNRWKGGGGKRGRRKGEAVYVISFVDMPLYHPERECNGNLILIERV